MDLIQYIAADVVGHIDLRSHAMRTVGGGNGQQQKHLLNLPDADDGLHELLVLDPEGVLKGVELLIDEAVVLEETLALEGVEDLGVVVEVVGVVALQDGQDLGAVVEHEEVDEAVRAAHRKARLVLQGFLQQDLLAESEEAVDVLHHCQLLQDHQGVSHDLAAHLW